VKYLITTRSDDTVKHMADISHPLIKEYAKKVNADFLILDHVPESDTFDKRPHFRIMKHYDLHSEYDRILHLDTDMLLMPNCPNLFEFVPYNNIGTTLEDKGTRKQARLGSIRKVQRKFGFINWSEQYINTGTILTSKCHKEIYQKINNEYWTGFGSDDVHLGYLIKKYNFKIMELPYHFNHMTMFSEPWNNNPDRFDSYIIHYAGAGIFDVNINDKYEQMKADYEKVYG